AKVKIVLTDSQDNKLDSRELPLSEWGTADWTFTLPKEAPLGTYHVKATVQGQKKTVNGSFLVAAYRKPDFRVDTTLGGADHLAGAQLKGVIQARYLFGAPMGGQSVTGPFPARSYTSRPVLCTRTAIPTITSFSRTPGTRSRTTKARRPFRRSRPSSLRTGPSTWIFRPA
ncbi:MAG: MG2 domain-containing protein, partial [Acidobacteriota bacterium]